MTASYGENPAGSVVSDVHERNIDSAPDDGNVPQMYVQDVKNYVPDINIHQDSSIVNKVDGTYCVSQVVPDTKNKTIWVTSARIQKADGGSQVPNADNSPQLTSETPLVSSSVSNTISQNRDGVNDGNSVYKNKAVEQQTVDVQAPTSNVQNASPDTTLSGNNIPQSSRTVKESGTAVLQRVEELSKNGEAITVEEAKRASGYGDNGALVLTNAVNNAKGRSFSQVKGDMHLAYLAGRVNKGMKFETDLQREAYYAGKKDAEMGRLTAKKKAGFATVYGEESGFIPNDASKNVPFKMQKALNIVAKDLGLKVMFEDRIFVNSRGDEANAAMGDDGIFRISSASTQPLYELIIHEPFHRMRQFATQEYYEAMNFAVQHAEALGLRLEQGNGAGTYFEALNNLFSEKGISHNDAKILDELAAQLYQKLVSSDADALRFIQEMNKTEKSRSALQKFMDFVKDLIAKLQKVVRKLRNQGEYAAAKQLDMTIKELEQARKFYLKAYQATREAVENRRVEQTWDTKSKRDTDAVDGLDYALKEDNEKDIYDYTKSFAQQIEDWKNGLIPQNDSLLVGATPDVLKKIGFNALPVTINQKHIDYAINGTKDADHSLGETLLAQLPKALENPLAIISSQTHADRVVAILKIQHIGKNIVAPVEIDGYGTQNNISIDSNAVTSVFGKGNAITKLLADALNDEANGNTSVFYWNKKEALSLLQTPGLQLPSHLPQDGFVHSIAENGTPVKPRIKNVTESQQFRRWFKKSKVVNEDGTPKVVYHGTRESFAIFDITKSRSWDGILDYDLPGFYFSESIDESGSYGEAKAYYINISKPYEGNYVKLAKEKGSYRKAYEYLIQEGYDGIIEDELGKGFTEYIVFKPENIKSATENMGTFDGNNPNVNYSLKEEVEVSAKRTKELLDTITYLKGQFETTKFAKADPKKLKTMTRKFLKEYSSKLDLDETTVAMDDLYRYLANGEDGHPAAWDEAFRRAKEIASKIAENAVMKDDADWTTYQDLRNYLRTTEMYVNPENFGDASSFRRRNFGRILVTTTDKSAMGVDEVFQELAELYPEFFNGEKAGSYSDKLYVMEDVLDSLKPLEFNPYANDMELATTSIANDILQKFFEVPQARPTYADKMEQRLAKERIEGSKRVAAQRENTKKLLERARASKEKALATERKKSNARVEKMSESRKAQVLRAKITRVVGNLSRKLVRPTDNQHIPQELQGVVAKLLESINMESNYTYDPKTKSYKKNETGRPTKKTEAFRNLKEVYAKIAENNNYGLV